MNTSETTIAAAPRISLRPESGSPAFQRWMNERLTMQAVRAEYCPLSVSRIYVLMTQGKFPRPERVGPRAVAWPRHALEAWRNEMNTSPIENAGVRARRMKATRLRGALSRSRAAPSA